MTVSHQIATLDISLALIREFGWIKYASEQRRNLHLYVVDNAVNL